MFLPTKATRAQVSNATAENERVAPLVTATFGLAAHCARLPGQLPKPNYLQAQFRRLSALRGPKRALIAVACSILTAGY
jgi:hypothetical protein